MRVFLFGIFVGNEYNCFDKLQVWCPLVGASYQGIDVYLAYIELLVLHHLRS